MRITDKDRAVLSAIQFRANATVAEIRKSCGLREHTVNYHLSRLKEAGIARPVALIDVYRLGFCEYEVYFSLAAEEKKAADRLLKHLSESPRVAWLAELGGGFQHAMTICAQTPREASDFLEGLAKRFGNIFFEKSIASIVSFSLFRKKYLGSSGKPPLEALTLGETPERVDIDETDRRIISTLFRSSYPSHRAMAQASGIARSTIEYRLKKLEEKGVILGYVYFINAAKIGMQAYKVLVYIKGLKEGVNASLYSFAMRHPNVVNFTRCLGSWDYEFTVEVQDPREMITFSRLLHDEFGGQLNSAQILPVFKQSQSANFMRWE